MVDDRWRDTDIDEFQDTDVDHWRDAGGTPAPTTQPPTTPPTTEPPTSWPTSEPPSTLPHTTMGPTTHPPVTEPPATEGPAQYEAEGWEHVRALLAQGGRIIPWIDCPAWQQEIVLDGEIFLIRGIWNDSFEFWTIDILLENATVLLAGLKLVPNWELIRRYGDDRLPPGKLTAYAMDSSTEAFLYSDFAQGRAVLLYEPVKPEES